MIINQHLCPGYSTEAILYNPVFLLRFEGSEGSTNFVDECGNSFVGFTGSEKIKSSSAISGCGGLSLPNYNSRISTYLTSIKSLTGVFTIDFEFKPVIGGNYIFFQAISDYLGQNYMTFWVDGDGLRWYTGIFGISETSELIAFTPPVFVPGFNYSIRISRNSDLFIRIWINGIQVARFFCDIDYTLPSGSSFWIGSIRDPVPGFEALGAVDNFALGLFSTPDGNYQRHRIRWLLP